MKCPHCGQEHPDNTKFCPETGQNLSMPKSCLNKECKNFGKYNIQPEAQFCPECGQDLEYTPVSKLHVLMGVGLALLWLLITVLLSIW